MLKILVIFALVLFSGQDVHALTVDTVLAVVNNEIITLSDYTRFLFKMGPEEKARYDPETKGIDKYILQKMIEENIILQEARKRGIETTEDEIETTLKELREESGISNQEFSNILIEEGLAMNDYKKLIKENIIALKLIDIEITSRIIVTDQDIKGYYKENLPLFLVSNEKRKVHAIFIGISDNMTITEMTDLKIRTLKIYEEIIKGEPFEKMVDLYSDEPLRSRSGLLGEFESGGLIPALEAALAALNEGDVSKPVWTTDGVYILKLTKTLRKEYAEMNSVRDTIYSELFERRSREKFSAWMKTLWEKSSIEIKNL
ncbi:MAG: peptidylprolyl isomerase [Nitrospiraceae bacterium]|nr:MAG: peptidylprolyl isomerase [Nitrospiraceae bacterium]